MKAYYLTIKGDDEGVTDVVFANTAREAKKLVWQTDLVDYWQGEWILLRANRAKKYDGMEHLSDIEMKLFQWKEGWRYIDLYNMPDPDEATDEQFIEWYKNNIQKRDK